MLRLDQVGDQRDGLDRLAEPHLIREDPIELVVVQRDEPAQPRHLVLLEAAAAQHLRLLLDARLHRVR